VHEYIRIYGAQEDRKVINIYEDVYQKNVISIEITKPSEQLFKALLDCKAESASLLLFTEPVGRQEVVGDVDARRGSGFDGGHVEPGRIEPQGPFVVGDLAVVVDRPAGDITDPAPWVGNQMVEVGGREQDEVVVEDHDKRRLGSIN